ncbi:MAG: glycoside hydrolase family 36 protein [Anaerocolumna sp.]
MIITNYNEVFVSSCDIVNITKHVIEINEPKMLDLELDINKNVQIHYYHSDWGDEFSPRCVDLDNDNKEFYFDSNMGRNAKHSNPNFYVVHDNLVSLFHIAWSGNFKVNFKRDKKLKIQVLLETGFTSILEPGERFQGFDVVYTIAQKSLNVASQNLHTFVREVIYNKNKFLPPVVWNHWWSYEDIAINEDIFKSNVEIASKLGFEYAMLDAGWFGDKSKFWELIRGDWHLYNKQRFPSGIKSLSDFVKNKGMKFGIWIEIEGLGSESSIYTDKPWLIAMNGTNSLEYICLGAEKNQNWAFEQFKMLIEDFGAEYIKLDFNLDPKKGCNCANHDHGPNDGLYAHYKGLYKVLKKVKEKYPSILLENCSSGGLRADMALLENMDVCFMSDPDYSEHSHQCYQGFRNFLPPERIFHFSWSHAIFKGRYAIPQFDFNNLNLTKEIKKYTIRTVSHHAFGISHPLIDYNENDLLLISNEINIHKKYIQKIVKSKLFCPDNLTIKNFQGNRNPYYIYENNNEILIYCYGLEMSEYKQEIDLKKLGLKYKKLEVKNEIDINYVLNGDQLTVKNKQQTASILLLKKV